ncbi:NfeD family protein [Roseateles sp. DB2]|uniref:NfeD family protein n=1 Tax=Roseateles sp. DB2 TaxID=3453717 RepID=UPI003EEFDFBE
MGFQASTWWWIVTGILVAAELYTGTFYLLMLAVGTISAALAAHAGLASVGQMVAAAVVGGLAVTLWHRRQLAARRHEVLAPAGHNPDVVLDIGQQVQVEAWGPDGHTEVRYRGASWRARYAGSGVPKAGAHTIRGVEGSTLLLDA